MQPRTRTVISWVMVYGPALAWMTFALLHYGPSRGWWPVLGLAALVAAGIVGLSAVFLARFPKAMEQLGFRRFADWLRTWWDEDAL